MLSANSMSPPVNHTRNDSSSEQRGNGQRIHIISCNSSDELNVINQLPTNGLTRLHVCQRHPQDLANVTFDSFEDLEELRIDYKSCDGERLVSGVNYPDAQGNKLQSISPLSKLSKLRILRVKAMIPAMNNEDLFDGLVSLQVLELSYLHRYSLDRLTGQLQLLKESPIQKLILKHVQTVSGAYFVSGGVNLSDIICTFGAYIEHVVLSCNFLRVLILTTDIALCAPKLTYLDISCNRIHQVNTEWKDPLPTLSLLYNLEVYDFSNQFTQGSEQWQKNFDREEDHTELEDLQDPDIHRKPVKPNSVLLAWFENVSLADIRYSIAHVDWCLKAAESCVTKVAVESCALKVVLTQNKESLICHFWKCIFKTRFPTFSVDECKSRDLYYLFDFMDKHRCKPNCFLGIHFPVPPNFKKLQFSNFNGAFFEGFSGIFLESLFQGICFKENQVEYADISYSEYLFKTFKSEPNFTGLVNLKYLSVYGSKHHFTDLSFLNGLPRLQYLNLGLNQVELNRADMFQYNDRLIHLNLSSCQLRFIHPDIFSTLSLLEILDLSHNRLFTHNMEFNIPVQSLKVLSVRSNFIHGLSWLMKAARDVEQKSHLLPSFQVDVDFNALHCGCMGLDWIAWLQTNWDHINITHKQELTCEAEQNQVLLSDINISYLKWDCNFSAKAAVYVCSTLFIVAVFVAVCISYRWRWHILHFCFRLRERQHHSQSESNDFLYDAFLLYSSKDEDRLWVHYELRQMLEDKYGLRLCIHHRDFLAGEAIMENVEHAIRSSRKVIAVISPNFVDSQWCSTELNCTNSVDQKKLILILFKDVSACDTEALLRHLLTNRTYVEWNADNEKAKDHFWGKMRKALYAK